MSKKKFEESMLNLRKTSVEKIQNLNQEKQKWEKFLKKLNETKDLAELRRQTEIHLFCLEENYNEFFEHNRTEENYH